MSDFTAFPIFSPCMHRHVVVVSTGIRRFEAGEVTDDIEEHVECIDCSEYLSELEVRAAWEGNIPSKDSNFQLGKITGNE